MPLSHLQPLARAKLTSVPLNGTVHIEWEWKEQDSPTPSLMVLLINKNTTIFHAAGHAPAGGVGLGGKGLYQLGKGESLCRSHVEICAVFQKSSEIQPAGMWSCDPQHGTHLNLSTDSPHTSSLRHTLLAIARCTD